MNIKKIKTLVSILAIIFLGGFMVKGGINKFLSSSKSSHEIVERAQDLLNSGQEEKLKKNTVYLWTETNGIFLAITWNLRIIVRTITLFT